MSGELELMAAIYETNEMEQKWFISYDTIIKQDQTMVNNIVMYSLWVSAQLVMASNALQRTLMTNFHTAKPQIVQLNNIALQTIIHLLCFIDYCFS